jgi:hypothetical protein
MLKRAAFPLIPQCSEAEQAQSRAIRALINRIRLANRTAGGVSEFGRSVSGCQAAGVSSAIRLIF